MASIVDKVYVTRLSITTLFTMTNATPSFTIDAKNKSYKHQFSNIYFTRLTMLRKAVEQRAEKRWKNVAGKPTYVRRVLDVVKSQLCWIVGTVYIDMPLKPNVLQDIGRDHSIAPPPPPVKFNSDKDVVMLEDESGRITLVGEKVKVACLVTGVIVAVLGVETLNGEFEAIDVSIAGLAPFCENGGEVEDVMNTEEPDSLPPQIDEYIGIVSGLQIGSPSPIDAQIQMLVEFLVGEAGGPEDRKIAAQVSCLVIAGNSLAIPISKETDKDDKKDRRFKKASSHATFSPHPAAMLAAHLLDLSSVLPVHILPGPDDPAGAILPQQPFPRAMFGKASSSETFYCETNPVWLNIECENTKHLPPSKRTSTSRSKSSSLHLKRNILITSGQPVLDMYKYLSSPPSTCLSIAMSTLMWQHIAPTAPDTLWCHPFRDRDPFVLHQTPDIYVVGNAPEFATALVRSGDEDAKKEQRCRVVLVPSFAETGLLVLVNLRTLNVRCVGFGLEGTSAMKKELDSEKE
ncbi:hypothetical protein SERLADRAFT_414551 [Serpula lacrymans var. lacrymans S7.9]|uniref:DNA-directed DNA polymerase n=1 Tax=Serpula lacrymans var. lacrymans (strain S7.9) TaxID=578457 RepID=F8NQB3_SERL9|nr:uncharacterized protein SERLADRAFT_414551 [Serpula lacrymans var. lacrymans S7.9]EGO26573.1 hypothetical protein SERLADRAFT_414551 [Serpula lacrymans var. lacrymans S7.9]